MKSLIILLIFIFYPLVASAEIDERKIDIYFANGILVDDGNATANTKLLRNSILDGKYHRNENEMYNHIGKVSYAYNSTHGFIPDGIETIMQKFGLQKLIDLFESLHLNITSHLKDITLQTQKYKKSIKDVPMTL